MIPDKKDIKKDLENKRSLNFLNDYNPFFIKKYLQYYQKANVNDFDIKYKNISKKMHDSCK